MNTYVFDLDGTMANIDHRLHYIKTEPKNWEKFFDECVNDKPIQWVIDLMNNLYDSYTCYILILSGRSDRVKNLTNCWLRKNNVDYDYLRMRKEGDHRPDEIVKLELLNEFLKKYPEAKVKFIVDDRSRVVDMWRANGYNVLQCNKWEE